MEYVMAEETENVCLADAYMDGTILYAAGFEANILLEYDLEGRKLERLGWLDGFRFSASYQNMGIYRYNDSLFCFSINSYEVVEYDLRTRTFLFYHPTENDCKVGMVCSVCRVGEEVWMFREVFDELVMVFSMKTRSYRRCHVTIMGRDKADHYVRCDFENAVCIGTKIWRCVRGSSKLAVLDVVRQDEQIINTDLQVSFVAMNCENQLLYIISEDGRNLAVHDTDCNETVVYATGYAGAASIPFSGAAEAAGRIFLFPCFEKEIFCYEKDGDGLRLIRRLELPREFRKIHDPEHRTMFIKWKKFAGALWLLPFAGNGMLRIAPESFQIIFYPLKISKADYFYGVMRACLVVKEGQIGMEDYLQAVEYGRKKKSCYMPGADNGVGQVIWAIVAE